MSEFEQYFRVIVEKVFNYWPNLKLAVEHGMGGRNGQQTAIQIMNYVYAYCIGNEKITQGELQDVLEDLMDQEFNTLCDDNSIPEICGNLLRYLQMCKDGKYAEIELEFQRLPPTQLWLQEGMKIEPIQHSTSSDEESDGSDDESSDSEMDIDSNEPGSSKSTVNIFVEPEPGWTTVRSKKKN